MITRSLTRPITRPLLRGVGKGKRVAQDGIVINGLVARLKASKGAKSSQSVHLNAPDKSYLTAGNVADANFGTGDFLISVWVYRDSTGEQVICGKRQDASNYWYLRFESTGEITFKAVVGGVTEIELTTTATFTTTVSFSHVLILADRDGSGKIYVDNSSKSLGTSTMSATDIDNTGDFVVGQVNNGGYYDGRLDSLFIGKPSDVSAIESALVTSLYNSGNGKTRDDLTDQEVSDWGLVIGYDFDRVAGTRYDRIGDNDLTEAFDTNYESDYSSGTDNWVVGSSGGADPILTGNVDGIGGRNDVLELEVTDEGSGTGSNQRAEITDDNLGTTDNKLYDVSLDIYIPSTNTDLAAVEIIASIFPDLLMSPTLDTWQTFTFQAVDDGGSHLRLYAATASAGNSAVTAGDKFYIDNVTVTAAEILSAPGIPAGDAKSVNYAAEFDGSAEYLSLANGSGGSDFNLGTGDFWFHEAFWRDSTGQQTIYSKREDANNYVLLEINSSNVLHFIAVVGGVTKIEVTGSTAITGLASWRFLSLEGDRDSSANTKIYLDNTDDTAGTPTVSTDDIDNTGDVEIGRHNATFWHGRMDDLYVNLRLPTTAERDYLFNDGLSRQPSEIGVAGTDGANLKDSSYVDMFDLGEADGQDRVGENGHTLSDNNTVTRAQGVNFYGGAITALLDQSGNGHDVDIDSNAAKPVFIDNELNGKPVIRFDGVDDWLRNFLADVLSGDTDWTMFVVCKPATTANDAIFQIGDQDTTGGQIRLTPEIRILASGSAASFATAADTGAFQILTTRLNGNNTNQIEGWKDGTSLTVSNASDQVMNVQNGVSMGNGIQSDGTASEYLDVDIADILIYNRALSDSERLKNENYLTNEYAL